MAHNVQMPPDLNISTQREGGGGERTFIHGSGSSGVTNKFS